MQQPSSSSNVALDQTTCKTVDINQNQVQNSESIQEQCRAGRRNALTPESKDIEPIRQTEIQEKMSTLTMSSSSGSDGSSSNIETNNNPYDLTGCGSSGTQSGG